VSNPFDLDKVLGPELAKSFRDAVAGDDVLQDTPEVRRRLAQADEVARRLDG